MQSRGSGVPTTLSGPPAADKSPPVEFLFSASKFNAIWLIMTAIIKPLLNQQISPPASSKWQLLPLSFTHYVQKFWLGSQEELRPPHPTGLFWSSTESNQSISESGKLRTCEEITRPSLARFIHVKTKWIAWMRDGTQEAKRETPI